MRHFARLWRQMQDLPRHLGQHSGGMVICQGDLSSVVPLENASMPGRVVVQWDKDDCADMGIIKVDLLGLGMMAVLQDTLTLINSRDRATGIGTGRTRDPSTGTRATAKSTLAPLAAGRSRRLRDAARGRHDRRVPGRVARADGDAAAPASPSCFYDLVVQVAIIRPGPIVGQMVHPYLNRRAGREPVVYAHPLLEPVLARTLGVPLFQEQLLRMAMVVAGFTGGQAEELRRAMGFKRSEKRMKQIEVQLREGMAKHGITGEAADRIVLSITSFALYGFPESHAASFALLAYASAYLKVHYPAAFYTALLNNQPMGFYHPATLVKDAQRRGVRFAPDRRAGVGLGLHGRSPTARSGSGLRYVSGLRAEIGKAIAARAVRRRSRAAAELRRAQALRRVSQMRLRRSVDDRSRQPQASSLKPQAAASATSARTSGRVAPQSRRRFRSLDDLVRRIGLRRDEVTMLAEIGALNSFGHDRRSALWQVERAIRPAGELFESAARRDAYDEPAMHRAPQPRDSPARPR